MNTKKKVTHIKKSFIDRNIFLLKKLCLEPQKSDNGFLHQSKYLECSMTFENSDYIFQTLIKFVVHKKIYRQGVYNHRIEF